MGVIGVRRRDPMGGLGCPRRAIALGTFPMAPCPYAHRRSQPGCARTWLRLGGPEATLGRRPGRSRQGRSQALAAATGAPTPLMAITRFRL